MSLRVQVLVLALAVVGLPVAFAALWQPIPAAGTPPPPVAHASRYAPSPLLFHRRTVGPEPVGHPRITNVQVVDLDLDGTKEVLVCDAGRNALFLYRPDQQHGWIEETIARDVAAPAHANLVDLDQDGDLDVLVAILGNVEPDDGVIGRVELFEQTEHGFERRVLLDDVRRVADVQAGDLDGDGDLDLAVAVFGYARGQVLWLENRGELRFRAHELLSAAGTIHVPIADFDGDGDLDIAAVVTQDEEEVWGFENVGGGEFRPRLLFQTSNFDLGGAGLVVADLDSDGDPDLILPAGDNLEDLDPYPQPYHGCYWLENRGAWEFARHRIADLGGTYAAAVADVNGDGHQDVVLVSMGNNWRLPGSASIVWLENDGAQQFRTWQIDDAPTHLVTVACGDVDHDGRVDIVAGGLHIRGPHRRLGRVTAWMNTGTQ